MAKKQLTQKKAPLTIDEMSKDLLELRRSNAAGELVNPRAITHLKKQIARAKTEARLQDINKNKEAK